MVKLCFLYAKGQWFLIWLIGEKVLNLVLVLKTCPFNYFQLNPMRIPLNWCTIKYMNQIEKAIMYWPWKYIILFLWGKTILICSWYLEVVIIHLTVRQNYCFMKAVNYLISVIKHTFVCGWCVDIFDALNL